MDQLENFNYHATPSMKKKFVSKLDSYSWIDAEYVNPSNNEGVNWRYE